MALLREVRPHLCIHSIQMLEFDLTMRLSNRAQTKNIAFFWGSRARTGLPDSIMFVGQFLQTNFIADHFPMATWQKRI